MLPSLAATQHIGCIGFWPSCLWVSLGLVRLQAFVQLSAFSHPKSHRLLISCPYRITRKCWHQFECFVLNQWTEANQNKLCVRCKSHFRKHIHNLCFKWWMKTFVYYSGFFCGKIRRVVTVHGWLTLIHCIPLEDEFGDLGCVSKVVLCRQKQWLSLWSWCCNFEWHCHLYSCLWQTKIILQHCVLGQNAWLGTAGI